MAEEFPVPADKLRKLIKKSRQMPIAFGFNAGTSDDDDEYLAAHERKAPELLGKIAKTEGAGTKSAFGTFVAEGSEMKLTCFQTIGQLAKKFKKYLKVNKVTLNVIVMDPDGNVIDSDVEVLDNWFREEGDDEDDEAPAAPPRTQGPAPAAPSGPAAARPQQPASPPARPKVRSAAPLAPPPPSADPQMDDRLDRICGMQEKLRTLPPAVAERLMPDLQKAVALLRDRRFEDVDAVTKQLVAVLARLQLAGAKARPTASAPPQPPPQRPQPQAKAPPPKPQTPQAAPAVGKAAEVSARMRGALDALRRQADGLPEAAAAGVRPMLDRATAALAAGEAEAALAAMRQARDRLRDVQAARQKWGKVQGMMQGPVAEAIAGGGLANPAALQQRWAAVVALADGGGWADALAAVPRIAALVRHAVLSARKTTA